MTRTSKDEFSKATKLAAWHRCNGRCEGLGGKCQQKLGGANRADYDHIKEVWEGGDNSLANCQVLGKKCCHEPKTTAATGRRAKADAAAKKHAGISSPARMAPRGFNKAAPKLRTPGPKEAQLRAMREKGN